MPLAFKTGSPTHSTSNKGSTVKSTVVTPPFTSTFLLLLTGVAPVCINGTKAPSATIL
ncbi:hypothetical protein [Mucilaginibacter humi]|uniref:hypothetical protein n=1 Tax=Mucilaginibacter humi TaxID=2732510 RepID=UPI001FE7A718|nr:hypothetical protein [Mucilaginibacter humi]